MALRAASPCRWCRSCSWRRRGSPARRARPSVRCAEPRRQRQRQPAGESLGGARGAGLQPRRAEHRDFSESNAANRDANIRAVAYTSALQPTLEALGYVAVALVAGVGGLAAAARPERGSAATVSLGLIVAFIAYTQRFNQPISQISALWTNMQSAIAGGERIFGLLDTGAGPAGRAGCARRCRRSTGRVVFDDVWAEYKPGQPVLRDVSLVAEPGQMVAIVGPTGAGKTTMVNLIPRFYDVTGGRGHDRRASTCATVTARSLRAQIGMVLQDSFLFSDTVDEQHPLRPARRDRRGGRSPPPGWPAPTRSSSACRTGYQTVLGERGSGLSLGQRQLLVDRARGAGRPAHPDPGRGDLVGRHPHRAADPDTRSRSCCAGAPRSSSPTA